jgi:predicted phosphodiesterase
MRVLIVSDIHSNYTALETVLVVAGSFDQLWNLGDTIGYGPRPNECTTVMQLYADVMIGGNHDLACLGKIDLSDFNPDARTANIWNGAQLQPDNRALLDALPPMREVDERFLVAHGSPREPVWEYLTHVSLARLNFDYFQTRYCLVGHTHVPLVFQRPWPDERAPDYRTIVPQENAPLELGPNRLIVNPGSVGQPRDGNPDAAYMMLTSGAAAEDKKAALTLRRVKYPVPVVQRKMREAGLPPRLITRLTYGW